MLHKPHLAELFNRQSDRVFIDKNELEDAINTPSNWLAPINDVNILSNWKRFLELNLTSKGMHQPLLMRKINELLHHPWNTHSQYLRALIALNQALLGMPVLDIGLSLLEGGAAAIELEEYAPWQAIPYCPYHAEFGVLISLVAFLTKNNALQKQALKLAQWQLNTLDASFHPLRGLFVKEENGSIAQILQWNYVFFRSIACLFENEQFQKPAAEQIKFLKNLERMTIQPVMTLLEALMEFNPKNRQEWTLSEEVKDPSTSLVGVRFPHHHAFCTIHGAHTGLGTFKLGDIDIVNYGPQFLPLEECKGFGIEGNYLSEHGLRKSLIEIRENGFSLKGCARMVDQPSEGAEMGLFRGIWMEMEQTYQAKQLEISLHLLAMQGWEQVAFSFFVKAKKCLVGGAESIHSSTLQRYEGKSESLIFEGKRESVLLSQQSAGHMHIIPLSGKDNYWGADFLVAFMLNEQSHHQWKITPI